MGNEQAHLEILKYKSEKEDATVMIPFHSNRLMDYNKQKLYSADIFFFSLFSMDLNSILSVEKSKADINSSMILMLFNLI